MSLLNDINQSKATARCIAMKQDGKPIAPCATCAHHVRAKKLRDISTAWWTVPPAFWNGERYVCDKYMEIKNGQ